jgi:hypothetical protein
MASRARMLWRGTAAALGVQSVGSDKDQVPQERRKTSRGRTALLALDAELSYSRNGPWTTERESRRKGRNLKMRVFLADVRVKENRKILLCERRGGIIH